MAIAEAYGALITLIAKEEFSFGRSLNQAIAVSNGDYCIIVSAHCVPTDDNWASRLLHPLIQNDRIAICYGRQVGGEETKFSEHQVFNAWFPAAQSDVTARRDFCNNANAAIRKSLWEAFKYDENLTGLEDLDWARRVCAEGYTVYYEALAIVTHHHDESWGQVQNRYYREAIALKKIYPNISMSRMEASFLFVKHVVGDFLQLLKSDESLARAIQVIRFRKNQYLGTYKGLNKKDEVSKDLKRTFYY